MMKMSRKSWSAELEEIENDFNTSNREIAVRHACRAGNNNIRLKRPRSRGKSYSEFSEFNGKKHTY